MLVLTRHPQESIIIGKNLIKIKVLEIQGQSVRIGIEAPNELSVHREEIYHRINGTEYQRPVRKVKEKVIRTIDQLTDMETWGNK